MLTVEASQKIDGIWYPITIPETLSERIAAMKALAGFDCIIKLKTSATMTFLCGTNEMVEAMQKKYPDNVSMAVEDAVNGLEHAPLHFLVAIQAFCTDSDVKTVFPEVNDGSKGWDHLKPKEAV